MRNKSELQRAAMAALVAAALMAGAGQAGAALRIPEGGGPSGGHEVRGKLAVPIAARLWDMFFPRRLPDDPDGGVVQRPLAKMARPSIWSPPPPPIWPHK